MPLSDPLSLKQEMGRLTEVWTRKGRWEWQSGYFAMIQGGVGCCLLMPERFWFVQWIRVEWAYGKRPELRAVRLPLNHLIN